MTFKGMILRGKFLDFNFHSMFSNLGSFENFSTVMEKCFQKLDLFPFSVSINKILLALFIAQE